MLEALGTKELAARYHSTRFVQIGSMAGLTMTLPAGILRSAGITISGVGLGSVPPEALEHIRTEALPKLFGMAASGQLRLEVQEHKLADVEKVWAAGDPSGARVVLTP